MRMLPARALARLTLATLLLATLFRPASAAPQTHLSILTATVGGVFYPLGVALARLITRQIPNTEATAEITSGSVENLRLVGAKRADLAFAQADIAYAAFKGLEPFKGTPVAVQTLTPLYNSYDHLVTIEGTRISNFTDLRGKRVAVGPPQSGTQATALRVLEAGGINPDRDIRKEQLGVAPSADALAERRIDAFFWIGGLPTPTILALTTKSGIRMKLVPLDSVLPALQRVFKTPSGPLYFKVTILKEFYPGLTADTPTVGLANLLIARSDFDPELAYRITKLLYEHRDELARAVSEAKDITFVGAAGRSPLPFSAGAIRYFRERAVEGF